MSSGEMESTTNADSGVADNTSADVVDNGAEILQRMLEYKQFNVKVGPILQHDLMSSKFIDFLKLEYSADIQMHFENKEGKNQGYCEMQYELNSPLMLLALMQMINSLRIEGRKIPVTFPNGFLNAYKDVKNYWLTTMKEKVKELDKYSADLRSRQVILDPLPSEVTKEDILTMFPEVKKVIFETTNKQSTEYEPSHSYHYSILSFEVHKQALLEFGKETEAQDCVKTTKSVILGDHEVPVLKATDLNKIKGKSRLEYEIMKITGERHDERESRRKIGTGKYKAEKSNTSKSGSNTDKSRSRKSGSSPAKSVSSTSKSASSTAKSRSSTAKSGSSTAKSGSSTSKSASSTAKSRSSTAKSGSRSAKSEKSTDKLEKRTDKSEKRTDKSEKSTDKSEKSTTKSERVKELHPGTSTSNPSLAKCRVFVGNVSTKNLLRKDLVEIFSPYGRILGLSVHNGFAFVQYGNEHEAIKAQADQNGKVYGGMAIDTAFAQTKRVTKRAEVPAKRSRSPTQMGRAAKRKLSMGDISKAKTIVQGAKKKKLESLQKNQTTMGRRKPSDNRSTATRARPDNSRSKRSGENRLNARRLDNRDSRRTDKGGDNGSQSIDEQLRTIEELKASIAHMEKTASLEDSTKRHDSSRHGRSPERHGSRGNSSRDRADNRSRGNDRRQRSRERHEDTRDRRETSDSHRHRGRDSDDRRRRPMSPERYDRDRRDDRYYSPDRDDRYQQPTEDEIARLYTSGYSKLMSEDTDREMVYNETRFGSRPQPVVMVSRPMMMQAMPQPLISQAMPQQIMAQAMQQQIMAQAMPQMASQVLPQQINPQMPIVRLGQQGQLVLPTVHMAGGQLQQTMSLSQDSKQKSTSLSNLGNQGGSNYALEGRNVGDEGNRSHGNQRSSSYSNKYDSGYGDQGDRGYSNQGNNTLGDRGSYGYSVGDEGKPAGRQRAGNTTRNVKAETLKNEMANFEEEIKHVQDKTKHTLPQTVPPPLMASSSRYGNQGGSTWKPTGSESRYEDAFGDYSGGYETRLAATMGQTNDNRGRFDGRYQ